MSSEPSSLTRPPLSDRNIRLIVSSIVYIVGLIVCFGSGVYLVTHEQLELGKQMIDFGKGFAGWGAFIVIFFLL